MDMPKPQVLELIDYKRAIKNKKEIAYIRKGCRILVRVFEDVKRYIHVGFTEIQIARFIENQMKKSGVQYLAFTPIVASGENSAHIHHWPTRRKIQKGDTIMIDIGANIQGYCSDMTRTLFFGKPSIKQIRMYHGVLLAQEAVLKKVKAQVTGHFLDTHARRILRKQKLDKRFTHNLGHGVGRYIHEWPRLGKKSNDVLQANMVVTIEPGVYIKGFGGVRIEDTVLVREYGVEILTPASRDISSMILYK